MTRREIISVLSAVMACMLISLPLYWGWVTMSDIGSLIAAFIVGGSILLWGFRDRLECWVEGTKKQKETLQAPPHQSQKDEFNLLIKPLYLAFDKYPSPYSDPKPSINSLINYLSDASEFWDNDVIEKSKIKEREDVDATIKIMKQHLELAQPKLRMLINQYLEIRRNRRMYNSRQNYYEAQEKAVMEIANLVRERYNELTSVN
jgi:hypothetical protein